MPPAGADRRDDRHLPSVSAPANVLLLAPAMSRGQDDCPAVGRDHADAERLVVVLLNGALEPRLDLWRRDGGLPEDVCVVTCEGIRATTAAPGAATTVTTPAGSVPTRTVSSPGNLTDLGLAIDRCLSACAADDGRVHVCFDSLTTLLNYVDVQRAFRFLHGLVPRVRSAGGLAHFHMDPVAHDDRATAIVGSLFDATYRYHEADDAWRID